MRDWLLSCILGLVVVMGFSQVSRAEIAWKGIQLVSWTKGEYSRKPCDLSIEKVKQTNANALGVLVTWYLDTADSTEIEPDPLKTPSDEDIIHAITEAHNRGLKVMLKPHLDVRDGSWRGSISPTEKSSWWVNYETFILKYARLAEANEVELFVVGTELKRLATANSNESDWIRLIETVRSQYTGALTYAANWDEFQRITFFKSLDVIGIDAYFPLSQSRTPTLEELESGWEKWIKEISRFQAQVEKPVILTEIGYRSIDSAAQEPWSWTKAGNYNGYAQARCYEAAIKVFRQQEWFEGMFWWSWSVNPMAGGDGDKGFTPQRKPAEQVLTILYGHE